MVSQDSFDPHTFLAHIGAGRTIATYRQQSPIFAQGDDADAVFYIQSGQVKLTVVSPQGKEAVIAILEAQAFFGLTLTPARYTYDLILDKIMAYGILT